MQNVWFTTSGWLQAPGVMLGDPTTGQVPMPTVVAVCQRKDGDIWLVDAGWGKAACEDPSTMGPVGKRIFGSHLRPGDDIASKLKRAGLDPSRVTTIIATHLHLDHVGGVVDFPNAELIATHSEMSEALRRVWDAGYRRKDLERIEKLRLVYLERTVALGANESLKLADDVTLLAAPGHTLGHVAVAIEQKDHIWIHAGDSGYVHREMRRRGVSPLTRIQAQDLVQAKKTQRWLESVKKLPSRPTVVLTHDAPALSRLPALPGEQLSPPVR